MTDNQNGGWSSDMLKKIDKEVPRIEPSQDISEAFEAIKRGEYTDLPPVGDSRRQAKVSYDPAPSAQTVALERLQAVLAEVTTTTLDQLRELRDEIDSLMQVIRSRDELINKAFKEHVAYASNTIKCKDIVKDNLAKIKNDFNNGLHPIPQTVTVQENKQQ